MWCILGEYLLPFSRLPFHFVDGFLCCAKTFKFDVVLLVYFFFCFICPKRYIRKKYCYEKCLRFYYLCFLPGFLWFLRLTSIIWIHLYVESNEQTNQQNRNKLIDSENRLTVVRGEAVGGLGEIGEGIKQKTIS